MLDWCLPYPWPGISAQLGGSLCSGDVFIPGMDISYLHLIFMCVCCGSVALQNSYISEWKMQHWYSVWPPAPVVLTRNYFSLSKCSDIQQMKTGELPKPHIIIDIHKSRVQRMLHFKSVCQKQYDWGTYMFPICCSNARSMNLTSQWLWRQSLQIPSTSLLWSLGLLSWHPVQKQMGKVLSIMDIVTAIIFSFIMHICTISFELSGLWKIVKLWINQLI